MLFLTVSCFDTCVASFINERTFIATDTDDMRIINPRSTTSWRATFSKALVDLTSKMQEFNGYGLFLM